MSAAIELLKQKNEYPIVFIGSGISKRYLVDFPSWEDLLDYFWQKLNEGMDFYAFLNTLKKSIVEQYPNANKSEITYHTNIEAATVIETKYNSKFFKEEITIENFTQRDAYKSGVSPFKKAISNRFSEYQLIDNGEYPLFQKFLNKAQIILTTNYDGFLERSFNSINSNGIKKYIGQKGFFEQTLGWAEIYKLHGSYEDPSSIVITKDDYENFNKNSVLISAKIISLLVNSPIIFIGYSLTDLNVRKILQDFSSSLSPSEIEKMSTRIIIIERKERELEIKERTVFDKELGCQYTVITTDNYAALYEQLIQINQGVSPSEVRRYQRVIRQLIEDRGRKGALNSLLIAPQQLEDLEKRIGDENLVVALGDATYIFQMPDLLSYVYDYVFDQNEIPADIALRFVASQAGNARIPFLKYLHDVDLEKTILNPVEKEKIRQRLRRFGDLEEGCISSINDYYRIQMNSLEDIVSLKYDESKEQEIIGFNVARIELEDLERYIREKVSRVKEIGVPRFTTQFRRLLLSYDILKNKKEVSVESAAIPVK
ncbi:hypothetical protein CBW65_20230 [Tumebacillus avium]|uniref:Uncharacterized protein n=1 Tax=Tumebacillus avium TaxID=1903704 RepID=A0A1Y0IRA4_9BACL|nr:SIR2 family protein [Tumebacillus avium]ARU63041.1 hypothetical protein CBW65_20230 [Tumebacillus avium]